MRVQAAIPLERGCPRSWSSLLVPGLLSLAVSFAGFGLQSASAAPDSKKDETKKEEPKKAPKQTRDPFDFFADLEKMFDNLPQGLDAADMKKLREEMKKAREEMKKALENVQKLPGGALQVLPGRLHLNLGGRMHEGRLGARVDKPSDTLVDQLDLPPGQGLIVESIKPDSAASKAGLKQHDILLEVNGKAVPSNVEDFIKQLGEIKGDKPVDVTVLRKGKKETVKGLSLPEARQPRTGVFARPAAGGAPGTGGKVVTQEINRNNDNFTARRQDGDLIIAVTGTLTDGKPAPATIEITDAKGTTKYDSIDKVPEDHRAAVKKLIGSVATGNIKIEIKP